jgi:LysM repeat protein
MKRVFRLAVIMAMVAGCNPASKPDTEAMCARAKRLAAQGDATGAAAQYEEVLLADPHFANAHLEVGLLYDEKLGDPVSAIYHYRQFVKLTPQPAKQQVAKDFIERAELTMASKLPQSNVADPMELRRLQDEKAALMQENIGLKDRVAALEKKLAEMPVAVPVPPPPVPVAAVATQVETQPAPVPVRAQVTHVVQKGDTLQSLALRYYGTRSAWMKIYEANRNTVPSPSQLKIGQPIVIP